MAQDKPKLRESKKIGARASFLPKTISTPIYELVWNLRMCVEVFRQRKSSDSTRAHRSGLILFGEKTCSCTDFLRFTEFWFVLGHDPLEVAYLLPGESLCKVSGQSKLVCLSFGLGIGFSQSLLVHTRHVRWVYRTYPVDTFEFGAEIWCRPTLRCLEAVVKFS